MAHAWKACWCNSLTSSNLVSSARTPGTVGISTVPGFSFFRNPFIAKFFRNIGLADELGSGMRNLYKYSKPYSGKDPVLDDGDP